MTAHVRSLRGAVAYQAGLSAEEQVAAHYRRMGGAVVARRWRGRFGGEIDLIVEFPQLTVFVEVKRAATHELAAERLGPAQLARIGRSAEEYMGDAGWPGDMRIDLALVDAIGRIDVIENVSMMA